MHILVAEDEEMVALFIEKSLTKKGHIVDLVKDGEAALHKATTVDYDVIVLDIVMPKMYGTEVCQKARKAGVMTPIIMLTSMDAEESRVKGLNDGADDYMTKPYSILELEARLMALNRRPKVVISNELKTLDVVLNTTNRSVTKNGETIELRKKEIALLEFLLRSPEKAFSREEILNHVWGVNFESSSNRVDACVKEIRNKLGKEIIITIPKTGYRIGT